MNKRLLAYLRSLGLAQDATEQAAWEFYAGLRGMQRSISNSLNYVDGDEQARTNCDLQIRSMGYDPANPSDLLAVESAPSQPAATSRAANDGASLAGDIEAAAVAERSRIATITQLAAMGGVPDALRTQAINEGWTVQRAGDAFSENFRTRNRVEVPAEAPAGHVRSGAITQEAIEAGILFRQGLDPSTQWARNDDGTPRFVRNLTTEMQRAIDDGWRYRNASLEDILRLAAPLDGIRDLPTGRANLMQRYMEGYGRAMSTSALSAIFTTNINSELLAAYDAEPDSTGGGWIRESDVGDFRSNERARMESGGALKKLPRGGEADHDNLTDAVETFKIARYAKQFVIDDQDIIDDNFGGLSGFVPSEMGTAARQLRADLVYSILIGNPNMRDAVALFHANHANLTASSALHPDTVKTVVSKMIIQTENSRNLNIQPRFLIVPPALQWLAMELLQAATYVVAGDTDLVKANYNSLSQAGLLVVSDSRLQNGVVDPTDGTGATTHAGSATTWFMASTSNNHTIEVAYRRGTGRVPQVRSSQLVQGRWGLGWDVALDIGAKALDWRGLAKATA